MSLDHSQPVHRRPRPIHDAEMAVRTLYESEAWASRIASMAIGGGAWKS